MLLLKWITALVILLPLELSVLVLKALMRSSNFLLVKTLRFLLVLCRLPLRAILRIRARHVVWILIFGVVGNQIDGFFGRKLSGTVSRYFQSLSYPVIFSRPAEEDSSGDDPAEGGAESDNAEENASDSMRMPQHPYAPSGGHHELQIDQDTPHSTQLNSNVFEKPFFSHSSAPNPAGSNVEAPMKYPVQELSPEDDCLLWKWDLADSASRIEVRYQPGFRNRARPPRLFYRMPITDGPAWRSIGDYWTYWTWSQTANSDLSPTGNRLTIEFRIVGDDGQAQDVELKLERGKSGSMAFPGL